MGRRHPIKDPYIPNLSKELERHLKKEGTLYRFLDDYRQMCNNFKPAKVFIPDKEDKPKNYDELDYTEKKELEKLGKSYAHALHMLLELGLKMHKKGLDYALIGGFGVLGHLYDHNKNFPLRWRGTEDIDLLVKDLGELRSIYKELGFNLIPTERVDLSMIPDRRLDTYITENPYHDRPIKVQERQTIRFPSGRNRDESKLIHRDSEILSLYGVPIRVPSKKHLIATKTGIRGRKGKLGGLKDSHDIRHLGYVKKLEDLVESDEE